MDSSTHPFRGRLPSRPASESNGAAPVETPDEATLPEDDVMSVIGNGIVVTGNIEAEVDLQIEGTVNGDIRCLTLILGERSSVIGNVFAERIRVSGTVDGGIETTDLAIEATARVNGVVTYSRLRIAAGGVITGSMTHQPLEDIAPKKGATVRLAVVKEAEEEPVVAPKKKVRDLH